MYSLEVIIAMNKEATRKAKKHNLLPYRAKCNEDEGVFKCPKLGDYLPKGFKITNTYFVDNSGFGAEDEPALTAYQFLRKVRKDYYYAIAEEGQFQVYINEYIKNE